MLDPSDRVEIRGEQMNKHEYKVTTTQGHEQKWVFIEYHDENDYGNGNYIAIERDDECIAYVDMRYTRYVFTSFCTSYLRQWFGDNLVTIERLTK